MNFNLRPLTFFRFLLFPFSLLYGFIVIIRNYLYNKNIIGSVSFDLPVIGIGNLSVGGTGKTPMAEYLITLLQTKYKLATLSRGYKRKTKGYLLANAETTSLEIGDEPMQFHQKFPDVAVAVGEERMLAIPKLLQDRPETNVIILDDSFQHRSVKPGFTILLSLYENLYTRDFFLPAGNLRDERSSYKRADVIVVTKCPSSISVEKKKSLTKELAPLQNQQVFFTTTEYGIPYHIVTKQKRIITLQNEVLLVCGIASPRSLKQYISQRSGLFHQLSFSDHHTFTADDLKKISAKFNDINASQKMIITTEKDAVKLTGFKAELMNLPVFVLPVQHRFLFNDGTQFNNIINTFIENFLGNKK